MSGHGAKLDRRREAAIAALLTTSTLGGVAKVVGVAESTLRRWLAEPDFRAAYREAREQAVRMAVGRLQALLAHAGDALERAMACGTPAVEVRAAGIVTRATQACRDRRARLDQRLASPCEMQPAPSWARGIPSLRTQGKP